MLTMLLFVTIALALVLLLRRPLRRLFGATPAFTLWLLPPLMAMLPWLPNAPIRWQGAAPLHVLSAGPSLATESMPSASSLLAPYLIWAVGTAVCLLRLACVYYRVRRQSRPLPEAMLRVLQSDHTDIDPRRVRVHPAGPALLWGPRSLLLLPANFADRFDREQRRLVLRHENTHLRRGDASWSLLGELMLALLWFHPLAWLALPRLRLDQELACDEQVLRHSPQDEAAYAHTLLHSTSVHATSMSIPWLAQPQLKERLIMIQRPRPGTSRRRLGFASLAILISGTVFVAQAAVKQEVRDVQSPPGVTGIVSQAPPAYPQSAINNKEEGTVVLTVLVGTDGRPLRIASVSAHDIAPDLIKAASDSVMHDWRFQPKLQNGLPVQGYARVPIRFHLSEPASTSSAAPAASPASS